MKEGTLKDMLLYFGDKIRIMVANRWNNGLPVFRDMSSGKPIKGYFHDDFSNSLHEFLKKCLRTDEDVEEELSFLLAELVWSLGTLTEMVNNETKWMAVYEKSASLSREDKVWWAKHTLKSIEKYLASDIPHRIYEEPVTFFRPHIVEK